LTVWIDTFDYKPPSENVFDVPTWCACQSEQLNRDLSLDSNNVLYKKYIQY